MVNKTEKNFIKIVNQLFRGSEKNKIKKALSFAKKKHQGQFYIDKIPYFIHPLRVALILVEEIKNKNVDLFCAALLHDLLEDCQVEPEELKKLFGSRVLQLILGVTRPRPENENEKEKVKSKLKKIKAIAKANKTIRLLKLCDVLDNARSEALIPEDSDLNKKIKRWHKEFIKYLPIAQKTNHYLFNLFQQIKKNW